MLDFQTKIGVLGGGQLGKMLALAAADWHLPIHLLDESNDFPAAPVATSFMEGSFKDYQTVFDFGKAMDVVTIEIEHVNIEALKALKNAGIKVHPDPDALEIIKDKGRQKLFYQEKNLPTAHFQLFQNEDLVKKAIENSVLRFPFVQKSREAGYDGRGVVVMRNAAQLEKLLPGACLVEPLVEIEKEISVIAARNESGEVRTFPIVEMEFNPAANLVEFLKCPSSLPEYLQDEAELLAIETIKAFDICGLLAVEMFVTKKGELLINEVAPRPHNSGHHTIDSCYTSQFEQHLRGILNLPLGSTFMKTPSVMVNLLGAEGYSGPAKYDGIEACLAMEGVKIHLYGKTQTKPFRKMGHATILDPSLEKAIEKANFVKNTLKIIA